MKLTKIQQIAIGFGLVLAIVGITHFLLLSDDRATIEKIQTNIVDLNQKINIAKAIEKTAAELQDEMVHLRAQLDRLKKILPISINEPKFLADVKRIANENGLEIVEIVHLKPVIRDTIVEHPFAFITNGNFHDFGRFYSQLTNYQRILNVQGLNLWRAELHKFSESVNTQEYTTQTAFMLSIFTYKEPTEEELMLKVKAKKEAREGSADKKGSTGEKEPKGKKKGK